MKKIINWCLDNHTLVIIITIVIFIFSLWSIGRLKLDAIPDLSDTQVIIMATYNGQPPRIMEDIVTYPLTTKMLSIPKSKAVRAFSYFNYSLTYILFEDGTDIYWARSRVLEYLNTISAQLPPQVKLELGPDATAIGWIFEYALLDKSGTRSLADMRDLQDFHLKYELSSLQGIAEVASLGGFKRQFQVEVAPDLLYQYNISLNEIEMAIKKSNMEIGAGSLEHAETEYMILAKGYVRNSEEIGSIPIRNGDQGSVLRLRDIAHITEGPEMRRGIADLDGKGEVVGGIVLMRQGEDVMKTTELLKQKISSLQKTLPKDIEIVPTYDRSILISRAVENLTWKLTEELIIVALITVLFLFHVRSALIAFITLPVSIVIAFMVMQLFDIPANILSMGGIAIAIGDMVDSATVMVENNHKHLERLHKPAAQLTTKDYWQATRNAVIEVGPALFWSTIITMIGFFPVFALPEQSGRMFIPLALTKSLALGIAAIVVICFMPILMAYFIRGKIRSEKEHPISKNLILFYLPILRWSLEHKKKVVIVSLIFLSLSFIPLTGIRLPFTDLQLLKPLGTEFMPPLEEGDLLYMPTTMPGISVTKAKEILIKTDQLIKQHPEVKMVFGKVGRAETATDPAPMMMLETVIQLKDQQQWRSGMTIEKIIDELDKTVKLPGVVNSWTMPIKTRVDMLATGIKTPIGIKIMGDDLNILQELSMQLEKKIGQIEGVRSAIGERPLGGNYIIYEIDRERAGAFGLQIADIQNALLGAQGGMKISEVISGKNRWSIALRYNRSSRQSLENLNRIYVPLNRNDMSSGQIPISEVLVNGKIKIEKGPDVVKTENGRQTSWIYIDTSNQSIGDMVEKIQFEIDSMIEKKQIDWPENYTYVMSGQYEQMQKAYSWLKILIPLVLIINLIILVIHFRNLANPVMVFLGALLFAPIGGLWYMYLAGFQRSVASDVGFIALIGLAAQTGILMMTYLEDEFDKFKNQNLNFNLLREIIIEGAVMRVRPKIMTATTTMVGLLPLFWGDEPGNVAMRRIAAPMVGGLISSTIVTLILIPVAYEWWHRRKLKG